MHHMLTDEAEIMVSGGHGGPGKVSFFRRGRGPDGGNGGTGGDLYFQTGSDLYALNRFASQKSFSAAPGQPGGSNRKSGQDGSDLTLVAPLGTDLVDLDSGEIFSLNRFDKPLLLCRGGQGGLGNAELKSARNTTPLHAQTGLPGQQRHLRCTLKLIADVGLIGLPNAGKSSLLNALTSAKAKVGDYSFTTLEPNLGVTDGLILADIPGLIAGASQGKGLGIKFLKHIEKVSVLLHCLASTSLDPERDYAIIREEMQAYNPTLLDKREILLLTKVDLVDKSQVDKIKKSLTKKTKNIIPVSVLDDGSIKLIKDLFLSLQKRNPDEEN